MEFVGIDKFSLLDYDEKVSIVLFSQGCNFRCPFCHNGKTVLNSNEIIKFEEVLDYLKLRKQFIYLTGKNEMPRLKNFVQTVTYLPHFLY